jgi:hypothetical protein
MEFMKRVICIFVSILSLIGCKSTSLYECDYICYFATFHEITNVTSDGTMSKVYDIEVLRPPFEFIKNPPEKVRLMVVDKETTAVEGEDFHLSTHELTFAKDEWVASFKLTIMPVISHKTLILKLDYTHPQLGVNDSYRAGHFAQFRILP